MKCAACAKDPGNPRRIDWADCPKHFRVEDIARHRMLRIGTTVAVSVIVLGVIVICIVVPAVMLYD